VQSATAPTIGCGRVEHRTGALAVSISPPPGQARHLLDTSLVYGETCEDLAWTYCTVSECLSSLSNGLARTRLWETPGISLGITKMNPRISIRGAHPAVSPGVLPESVTHARDARPNGYAYRRANLQLHGPIAGVEGAEYRHEERAQRLHVGRRHPQRAAVLSMNMENVFHDG
jgi:hypothetical protein